ncbi:interleukin-32 [Diceros bicornis minor]|uniref:interleukin-32 n=1 Tax=Diceros bicornis minor TaxID=77932 RepID=UPI0026EA96C1|nr:interleukin-32 [Diceros bicornis minor]XP_058426203.1 interleukin-32 [Diceros bicornis minor]
MCYSKLAQQDHTERRSGRMYQHVNNSYDYVKSQPQGDAQLIQDDPIEVLQNRMCSEIVNFCGNLRRNFQGHAQVESDLEDMEDQFNEDLIDTVGAYCKKNNPRFADRVPHMQREIHSRTRMLSGHNRRLESPVTQQPRESLCDKIERLFKRLLERLQKTWQAVLAWVQEKVAACWRAFCSGMKKIWSVCERLWSSVAQLFIQV